MPPPPAWFDGLSAPPPGRRRPGAESRHGRRQSLQRLPRRGWRAAAAGAGRRDRTGQPARARRLALAQLDPRQPADRVGADEMAWSRSVWRRMPGPGALDVRQAGRAGLSGDLDHLRRRGDGGRRDGRIVSVRIALGACSAAAQRLPVLEARLVGLPATPALARRFPRTIWRRCRRSTTCARPPPIVGMRRSCWCAGRLRACSRHRWRSPRDIGGMNAPPCAPVPTGLTSAST